MCGVEGVRLAAADAQFYWMSAKIGNDQFVLYAFDGEPADVEEAVVQVIRCARRCPDLGLRVDDGCPVTYPAWVRRDVGADQTVLHGPAAGWAAWRLHVFGPVPGVPGTAQPSTVTVVQLGHALADGVRASAMAAVLFGRAP